MRVPSFSVVVIARNEARTLPRLAESLGDFLHRGGEWLLVDTGSDDGTVEVARRRGARVIEAGPRFHSRLTAEQASRIDQRFARGGEGPLVEPGQLLFDFAAAREFAGQAASNDFVWHVDSSDVVLAADLDFLDQQVREGGASALQYFLRLGTSAFLVSRFFDRRLYRWRGRAHEGPMDSAVPGPRRQIRCEAGQLSLRHAKAEKTRNYLAGLALDAIERPSEPRWRHYLGRELVYAGRFQSALPVLRGHARSRRAWPVQRAESLCLAGSCLEALGRPAAAATSYREAALADPDRRRPLLLLASLSQRRGDFEGAAALAAAALSRPRGNPLLDAEEGEEHDPHAILYWSLFWLGRRDEARAHWEACRRLAPDEPTFREHARLFAETTAPPDRSRRIKTPS